MTEFSLLVTGASGLVGMSVLQSLRKRHRIFALARGTPADPDLLEYDNISWLQADISNRESLGKAMAFIREQGGVDYVLHFAAFYDFNYDENPLYQRTNIEGARNLLEECRELPGLRRFIFASSLAACRFPEPGERLTEDTPLLAEHAYARSKRAGEEMLQEYSRYFRCCSVRFAAVFSDCCEYPPLYVLLRTWTGRSWRSRFLPGRGQTAVPYIHVHDLVRMMQRIIRLCPELPWMTTFIASPDKPTPLIDLFRLTTRLYSGKRVRPLLLPRWLAGAAVLGLDLLGRLVGRRPFERPWMIRYFDRQMAVDASRTREILGWRPSERYSVERRLLFLIERMKSYPQEWQKKNERRIRKPTSHPQLEMYEVMHDLRERLVQECVRHVLDPARRNVFPHYHELPVEDFYKEVVAIYQFLCVSVRTKDRMSVLAYAREIAYVRHSHGFDAAEATLAVRAMGEIIQRELAAHPQLRGMKAAIHDAVGLTFRMLADEIEGIFEDIGADEEIQDEVVLPCDPKSRQAFLDSLVRLDVN